MASETARAVEEKHDVSAALARAMRRIAKSGRQTKRSAVRLAIVEAIGEGIFAPGDYLPPETGLAETFDVSLGTVQAALEQLKQMGMIVRRRGDGTRVAAAEPLSRNVWHFRFLDKRTGAPLLKLKEAISVDTVAAAGEAAAFLCDPPDVVRIRRHLVMSGGMKVGAEMFLRPELVPGLTRLDPGELTMINIRPYLAERYGIVPAEASNLVRVSVLDGENALAFGLPAGETVFEILARTRAADSSPIYFQRIFVPVDACDLSF